VPLPALGELPQLTALSLAWRRLVDLKPVLMAVNNTSSVCCWDQSGRWQQRVVGWPEGVCRDGVPRSLIQGWSEVAELADVPLRRVDWSLTAAQRALDQLTQAWDGDLAWLVMEEKSQRLLLFRQGVPEVDHALEERDPLACQREIRACVSA